MRRTKRAVLWPKVNSSPPSILSRSMGAPSSRVPFVEPRSSTTKPLWAREILACFLDTFGSFITMSFSCERPTLHGPRPSSWCFSSPRTTSAISRARPWRLASSADIVAVPWSISPPLDSSVRKMRVCPEVSCGAPFSRGPSPPGRLAVAADPPKAECVFGLEAYYWGSHKMVVLVLRVGRSVLDQLVVQRCLVGPDGLRILFGEVHREIIRGVGARDRN